MRARDNYVGAVDVLDEDEHYNELPREQWRHVITLDGDFTAAELREIIARLDALDEAVRAAPTTQATDRSAAASRQ